MTPKDIGAWLLKRWPLVGGTLLLMALATSLTLDFWESQGATAQDPTPWPTPNVVFNTPTREEWAEARLTVTPILVGADPSEAVPTYAASQIAPKSKAHAEYLAAPKRRAIYLEDLDKVIHLPEGVDNLGTAYSAHCSGSATRCLVPPLYALISLESYATLDSAGYYFLSYGNEDDFQFLTNAGFILYD